MAEVPLVAIVDDDASALAAGASLIRALGFAASGFTTVAAFLASDALTLAVCVVVDVRMPEMGGFELLRRLVALERQVPTVLATAFPDAVERSWALTMGAIDYLSKPLRAEDLLRCVRLAATVRGATSGGGPG
ncbi:response regulator [Microbaculum marinum]|uniref:Response regulator n=1 Tax=Microbaculum marinum TaxID=1764581 RepID=A0AAW9RP90_9HYPH